MTTRLTTCWAIAPVGPEPEDHTGFPHSPSRSAAEDVLRDAARGEHGRWQVVPVPHSCWTAVCAACGRPLDPEDADQQWHYRSWRAITETAARCGWRTDAATFRALCPTCPDHRIGASR